MLQGYPLGLIYFNKLSDGKLEVLDGQQRITSLGRFVSNKFSIKDDNNMLQTFSGLAKDKRDKILTTHLLVYECEGTESEIKEWFKTINIVGVPLKPQELLNAVYSGEFVTKAKAIFSNNQNTNINKWGSFIKGSANRQDYLERALDWVSHGNIGDYMAKHRHDDNINELTTYFDSVIDWINAVFTDVKKEMCGLEWGRLYRQYHHKAYNPEQVAKQITCLYDDPYIKSPKGIFEYILGDSTDASLLDVRVFGEATKKEVYNEQTKMAKDKERSNCPLCAEGHEANKSKIWSLKDMEADHVTAWSKGGTTDATNCQMLCKTHNRAKGNR